MGRNGRVVELSVGGTRVRNHLLLFQNLGNCVHPTLFTPLCLCLSEETLKVVGPF